MTKITLFLLFLLFFLVLVILTAFDAAFSTAGGFGCVCDGSSILALSGSVFSASEEGGFVTFLVRGFLGLGCACHT